MILGGYVRTTMAIIMLSFGFPSEQTGDCLLEADFSPVPLLGDAHEQG